MPADGFDRNGKGIMPKPCQEQVPFPVVITKAIKQAPMVWRGKNVMMPRFQFGAIASEAHHLAKADKASFCQIYFVPGSHVRKANHPFQMVRVRPIHYSA